MFNLDVVSTAMDLYGGLSPTLIGWFPRATPALLLLSDNHLLVAKPILTTAVSSWQMCSS